MPRNINGLYTLPAGNPVVPGTLIETTWANPTMADLANEITQSLPRNGSAAMTGPLILSRDGILPKEAVTFQQLTASVAGQNSYLPAGAIQVFAMAAIPTGWLAANGAAVSRTTYANLFATIGTTYGAGNGVTTFNLPDLRGEFIRGLDNGRGADPGRTLGSNQSGANNPHTHTIVDPSHNHTQNAHTHGITDPGHRHGMPMGQPQAPAYGAYVADNQYGTVVTTDTQPTGVTVNSTTGTNNATSTGISINSEGTESRPRNVAMVYCIKAFGALQTDGLGTMAFQNKESVAIMGGAGTFTTLQCTTAPTNPNDVARLADVGGSVAEVLSADPAMILVDNTTPSTPILRPQTNIPNGIVKLDAAGKIPNALMDPTGYNYQGTWNASGGTLPSGAQLDGSMYYIDVAGTLNLYHSNGVQSATSCPIGTRIVYVTDSPTLPVPGWYYEPPPVLVGATASQIAFTPVGTIAAADVQAAIAELDSETQAALAGKAPTSAQTATGTSFTPVGTVAATDVQTAIAEVAAEAVQLTAAQTVTNKTLLAATNNVESRSAPDASPFGFRNALINADFRINQRTYTSAAVLAAGAYGHDRWKAGASGGDYSFTQLKSSTQITIAAGKSLIQVIEDANITGGSYVLSWSGTSQARVGLNSATPSGSYAASPIMITGQTAGTVLSVEFNTGTLNKVQLEQGSIATPFEQRPIGLELSLCQRYYQLCKFSIIGYSIGGANFGGIVNYKVTMRSSPTVTQLINDIDFTQVNVTTSTSSYLGADVGGVNVYRQATATGGTQFSEEFSASTEL